MIRKTVLVILTMIVFYVCIDVMGNGSVVAPDDGDKETIIERMQEMYDGYWEPNGKQQRLESQIADEVFTYLGKFWVKGGKAYYQVAYYEFSFSTSVPASPKASRHILIYDEKNKIVAKTFCDFTEYPFTYKIHKNKLEISSGDSEETGYVIRQMSFNQKGEIYLSINSGEQKLLYSPTK